MTSPTMTFAPFECYGRSLKLIVEERYNEFYTKLADRTWEPETFDFMQRNLDKDTVYIDVGSWIGITPGWASSLAKYVIAVEPEPYCCDVIERVISDNKLDNVTLLKGAVSESKTVDLFMVGGVGSSMSSLVPEKGVAHVTTQGIPVASIAAMAKDNPRTVKIDIEGYEYKLVEQLSGFAHPKLKAVQLAVHPHILLKTTSLPWPLNRISVAAKTRDMARKLSAAFGTCSVRSYSSLWAYLAFGVVLTRKCHGTEFEFAAKK